MYNNEEPVIIGYTTGVYDMFHVGHLRLLERAKSYCDRLVVGVTTDELSLSIKGKSPIIPFHERVEIVSALRCVNEVLPQITMDKFAAWEVIRFQRMFVGDDWKGNPKWVDMEMQFKVLGVELVYFPYTEHVSSSILRQVLVRIHGED